MNRRTLLSIPLLAAAAHPVLAQAPWKLIAPEEEERDRAAPRVPGPPDLPAPPMIDLLEPDLSGPVQNPVAIKVQFSAGPGREIDMRSFNATYGWLGIDITSRLLEHAVTTSNGMSAENVDLPLGQHKVTLSIADTTGKRASRTFQFSVSK